MSVKQILMFYNRHWLRSTLEYRSSSDCKSAMVALNRAAYPVVTRYLATADVCGAAKSA